VSRPSTPSKYSSNLALSRPPSASPKSLDYGLKVHLLTRSITASKCISKPARSPSQSSHNDGLPSASPNSLDLSLQVYLHTHLIMACKCISELARSHTPSVSRNSLDYDFEVHSITASKYLSKLAQSQPWSVSLSSIDHHFQVNLELLSSTACSQSSHTVCRWVAI
jgi:hypothetical protein